LSPKEIPTILSAIPETREGSALTEDVMKVDFYDAPLSEEGKDLLKDPKAAYDLLLKLLDGDNRKQFEVQAGGKTLRVSSPTVHGHRVDPTR
jgi:hypothetical protein